MTGGLAAEAQAGKAHESRVVPGAGLLGRYRLHRAERRYYMHDWMEQKKQAGKHPQ